MSNAIQGASYGVICCYISGTWKRTGLGKGFPDQIAKKNHQEQFQAPKAPQEGATLKRLLKTSRKRKLFRIKNFPLPCQIKRGRQ